MTLFYDFKLDDDGDLYIDPLGRDIVIAPSDKQHVKDILLSSPGYFKEFPLVGWDPLGRLNSKASQQEMNQSAKLQLQSDGYTVDALSLSLDSSGNVVLKEISVHRP